MKVEVSAQTYPVGAHFKALNKAVLVALLKTLEKFFSISSVAEAQCNSLNFKQVFFVFFYLNSERNFGLTQPNFSSNSNFRRKMIKFVALTQ